MIRHVAGAASLLVLTALAAWAGPNSTSKSTTKASTAASAQAAASRLDTASIHRTYIEGDFDHAIELIEDAMRFGGPFTHQDSIFIFKHLGVMHAAKYETRENGKAYMMQLLNVEPTAKIMDMYASDMIYMIFKNIKDEFDSSRPLPEPDTIARPRQGDRLGQSGNNRSHAWVGWTAGAMAVVGGVALGVHLLSEEKAPAKTGRTSNE